MTEQRHLSEAQIRLMQAARAMLAVLKRITEPGQGISDIREMAEFAIAKAEKAGITTEELP